MSIVLLFYWPFQPWPWFQPYGKTDDNWDVDLLGLVGKHIGMSLFMYRKQKV
jgi:hypothetical protein